MTVNLERLQDDLHGVRVLVNQQAGLIATLQAQQTLLDRTVKSIPGTGAPAIHNYVRDGDFSYSWNNFMRAVTVADDARYECYQVYTHAAPTVGQQLLEDSVYSGALVAASSALPDPARSDTPTMDPYWNRDIGYAMLGSTRTLDFPLPFNVAYPGRIFYVGFIAAKRSAEVVVPGRLYAGIWDNTAGQRDFINGDGFTVTAEVVGLPAATTSTEYLVVMTSDYGKTVKSAVVTVANAPSNASFVSGSVYVRLTWPRFAGFTQSDIYRKKGGVFVLLSRQSTVTQYFDQGDIQETVGNYPDTDATLQKAITYSQQGELDSFPVDGVDPAWRQYTLTIQIPSTYIQGNTTDKQWLRVGWDAALTGTDAVHGMLIDLVSLSPTSGSYAHHADDDKGAQVQDAAPSGSSQGGAGTGGSGFDPPVPGEGGERCVAAKMPVYCVDENLRIYSVMASELVAGQHRLLSVQGELLVIGEIESIKEGYTENLRRVGTELGGTLECTETHRLLTYFGDPIGTPVSRLKIGDPIVVAEHGGEKKIALRLDKIVSNRRKSASRRAVILIQMRKPEYNYFAGMGRVTPSSHNLKPIESQI